MQEYFDDIVPHPDGVDPHAQLIHERAYVVRAYRKNEDTLLLRGAVRDQKPPGLYVPSDPEPLTVHHMILDLHIGVPDLVIKEAHAVMEVHPDSLCPTIEQHYDKLVGLSIARGFTHKVRELFGGPRGCTHITALLQAMAPVTIQSMWSFRAAAAREVAGDRGPIDDETRRQIAEMSRNMALATNVNTCHVWDEHGEQVRLLKEGGHVEVPLWVTKRYSELGMDPESWRNRF